MPRIAKYGAAKPEIINASNYPVMPCLAGSFVRKTIW